MKTQDKDRLTKIGDTGAEAIAHRLRAARQVAGLRQTEVAAAIGISSKTLHSQEAKGAPSIATMRYYYRNFRIDFNFFIHGDYAQLPGDVQTALFDALAATAK